MRKQKLIIAVVATFVAGLLSYLGLQVDSKLVVDALEEVVDEYLPATQTVEGAVSGIVTYVIDGDTFKIWYNGREETVRVLGIDTPEVADSPRGEECYGNEASQFAAALLQNQSVTITTDASQDTYDVYGRLLGYVSVDGKDFGEQMILGGYAKEYTYMARQYERQKLYRQAEAIAQEQQQGLWSVCK